MSRADLLALDGDALSALANRGLVKRAIKDLAEGKGPGVEVDADGTVQGQFADGTVTSLPVGRSLDSARCSCPASGICRHLVTLVLAYQDRSGTGAGPDERGADEPDATETSTFEPWSPAEFDDDALTAHLGARAVATARRAHRAGYRAVVRRPSSADPTPQVELASCTVRFLVPHELGYAHADAARGTRDDVIALAVWAFAAADATDADRAQVHLDVGGSTEEAVTTSGLEAVVDLARDLLVDGVTHAASRAGALTRARRDLEARNLQWPLAVLDDLIEQLAAYHDRGARYQPAIFADLVVELFARHRAVLDPRSASPRSQVLGTEEASETRLRRVRLTSVGCRVSATADDRSIEVYLVHADTGLVLAMRRRWEVDTGTAPTGFELAARRLAGTTVGALAVGNVVTEAAARNASRVVRIASNRIAQTTVSPSAGAWDDLPGNVRITDLRELVAMLDRSPTRLVRPRLAAEHVRVVEIGEVVSIGYGPGDQRLDAAVTDRAGNPAMISATHRAACPAALDAIASTLAGDRGRPRFVSGTVRRTRGATVIDPLAIAATGVVVVPDLAPGTGDGDLAPLGVGSTDPLIEALDEALAALADAAHRGLGHGGPTLADRVERAAFALQRVGLHACAASLGAFAAARARDPRLDLADAWVDAMLRITVTLEAR